MTPAEIAERFPLRGVAIALAKSWKGVKGSYVEYNDSIYIQDSAHPVIGGQRVWVDLGEQLPGMLVPMEDCKLRTAAEAVEIEVMKWLNI